MDPINILILVNIIALFGANLGGAKKGLKTQITAVKEKPKTWLQQVPVFAAIILLMQIISLFGVGTLQYTPANLQLRLIALAVYVVFSWLQILAYRTLGESYAQEIVIQKNQVLVTKGIYGIIRHPQYMAQIIVDIAAGVALMSYIVLPLALIQVPIIIMRTVFEDKMLLKHFGEQFAQYKKKTGMLIPFIG